MIELPLIPQKWFQSLNNYIISLYNDMSENPGETLLEKTLYELLVANFTLWGYEDEARRTDLPDKDIANLKRSIDKNNQKRHDLMDSIDAILQEDIEKKIKSVDEKLPLNSETPASIFDRLMVLALRTYNLRKETRRKTVNKAHIDRCSSMLREVENRSKDLSKCLEELLTDYYSGRKRLKSYKQYKLYNDPALNPSLRK